MIQIAVLGAGVVGCSVAIVARALGHTVRLIAHKRITDPDAQHNPAFASAYPAASIIAHTVGGEGVTGLLVESEKVFDRLQRIPRTGVRRQRHFEIFEEETGIPKYSDVHHDLQPLSKFEERDVPKRDGVGKVYGATFNCFFCEMPVYGLWLDKIVDRAGVLFERRQLTSELAQEIDADIVVNCLGFGTSHVFPGVEAGSVYRGILVKAQYLYPNQPLMSYNYTPRSEIYANGDGSPADVYFYPRTGHCILGGTREAGHVDPASGEFTPLHPMQCETIDIKGIAVPRPIIDLNIGLIRKLTNKIPQEPYEAMVGYRHVGGSAYDPKIEIGVRRPMSTTPVLDCFGFGGAGVTLSWGAAFKVLQEIEELQNESISASEIFDRLLQSSSFSGLD